MYEFLHTWATYKDDGRMGELSKHWPTSNRISHIFIVHRNAYISDVHRNAH
jgi:hypothetical protein